jgi:DNA-binding GntR family transcriptional regulator
MVSMLSAKATPAQIRMLRRHSKQEQEARAKDDRPSIIRLSGEFHILIAEMVGNEILLRLMRELTSLTCLIITLYDKPNTPACPHTEHADLIDAIEANEGVRAAKCMADHLTHIEHTLNFDGPDATPPDIESLFD